MNQYIKEWIHEWINKLSFLSLSRFISPIPHKTRTNAFASSVCWSPKAWNKCTNERMHEWLKLVFFAEPSSVRLELKESFDVFSVFDFSLKEILGTFCRDPRKLRGKEKKLNSEIELAHVLKRYYSRQNQAFKWRIVKN